MSVKLADIADIRTGIYARPETDGEILYYQSKHFDGSGTLNYPLWPELKADETVTKHLLKPGEILFAAKGDKNFGAVFSGTQPAVASPTFLVLNLKDESILPTFVAWYLNEPETLAFLRRNALGSAMVSVPKSLLEKLTIPIPPHAVQQKIVQAWLLSTEEHRLRLKIADLRSSLVQQLLARSIK